MPLRNLIIVAVSALVSLACFTVAAKNRYANLFAEAMEVVEKEALREVPPQQLFTSAMDGMMDQLDDYSAFIAGERFKIFDEDMRQEFGGVGMYVETNPKTKRLFILAPMPGTPAFTAGLQIGDEIIEIDGENVVGKDRSDAVKLLRGPVNEPVELTIERHGEIIRKKLVRAAIAVPSVNGDYRSPDGTWQYVLQDHPRIGYIRLSQFGEKSAKEMRMVLDQTSDKIDGLILDLRNNPGGLLEVAIEICDFFVGKGEEIVSTRGRNGALVHTFSALHDPIVDPNLPLVVLVNRYSASASEIVAGCLQDHGRAIIIGEQSWGKGTVQNVIQMQRGTSALKLTTASYWRPSGKHIDRYDDIAIKTKTWGVHPDVGFDIVQTDEEVFDNLRYRSIRDLEGLISEENSELFAAIKRMRLQINNPDVETTIEPSVVPDTPAPDEPLPVVSEVPDADRHENPSDEVDGVKNMDEIEMDEQPHIDRPLHRAIEYFQGVLAKQRIAA